MLPSLPVKSTGVRTFNKLALSVDWAPEWSGTNQLETFDRRQRERWSFPMYCDGREAKSLISHRIFPNK